MKSDLFWLLISGGIFGLVSEDRTADNWEVIQRNSANY